MVKFNLNKEKKEVTQIIREGYKDLKFSKKLFNYGINPFIKIPWWKAKAIDYLIPEKDSIKDYCMLLVRNSGDLDIAYGLTPGRYTYEDKENGKIIENHTNLNENKLKSLNRHRIFVQISGRPGPEPSNQELDSKAFYEMILAIDNENSELKKMLHRQQMALMRALQDKWWMIIIGIIIVYWLFFMQGDNSVISNIGGMFGFGGETKQVVNTTSTVAKTMTQNLN